MFFFVCFFLLVFFKISFSLQKEEDFWKTKKKNWENLDQVLLKKRLFLDQVLTLRHIYIYAVVFNFGALFLPIGSRMGFFFREELTYEITQKTFLLPVKATQLWAPKQRHLHLGLSFNAFNYGALMLRNISTPLLNGHARAIFERFNSPSFDALYLTTSKSLKPLVLQRFVTISWVLWASPQTEHQNIFSSQPDNCKSAFRK